MLSRYDRTGASSRLRMLQLAPFLERNGWIVAPAPFFDSAYLGKIYDGGLPATEAISSYVRRFRQLLEYRDVDVLWIEKEALPWVPWVLERMLLSRGVPVVTDFDDAVFHRYDLHRFPLVRHALGRKIDKLMLHSDIVFGGNAYLAERARIAGARRVEIVPTVVDTENYTVIPPIRQGPTACIGWIGTPSTWKEYVGSLMPLLGSVAETHNARILAVGAGQTAEPHPLLDRLPWSEETEVAMIQGMDVGIMPLTDTPWARGKCGYKLIQYMACGLPTVASPVGVNVDIVEHGVNGFLASTETEWRWALGTLLSNPDLRRRMGAAGRRKVERDYSLQVWGPRVATMLRQAALRGGGR